MIVAVIGLVGLVLWAPITGGFGLRSDDKPATTTGAHGGGSTNTDNTYLVWSQGELECAR